MIAQYVSSHVKEIVFMSTVIVLLVFTLMSSPSIHVFPKSIERTSIGRPINCQKEIDDFVPLKDFMSHNSSWHEARFQQIMKRESLVPGGRYVPEICGRVSKFRTLILVPYRDRSSNLIRFLSYMHSFLQRQDIEYQIFIISQFAMNRTNSSWDCVVYHDVDHLPENEDNIYTCWDVPRHMNSNDDNNGRLLYSKYFGGVSAMKPAQYIKINGYSNRFFGWGGEDDDVQKRITKIGLEWRHVDLKTGRYFTLGHKKAIPNSRRFDLLRNIEEIMLIDGLNSIQFTLLSMKKEKLFTNVTVALAENSSNAK
ncbi:beta-1,4-galactosyltransferase 4-like isoform X2 [Tigriopus californicus]|uniref:beta-1,4-galactosyltransferase 4-like isoform X2 n=1 Tax=Tigriopus californicus TaxID=6832 RepID=UPI0027DA213E|nr:beta-1,4-galactosyltransferase 4-like isoform X2 [Tigriopus californicus]